MLHALLKLLIAYFHLSYGSTAMTFSSSLSIYVLSIMQELTITLILLFNLLVNSGRAFCQNIDAMVFSLANMLPLFLF